MRCRACVKCSTMASPSRPYSSALEQQLAKIDDVERTPSARLLTEMRQTGETFFQLALRMSKLHKDYFLGLYPPNERRLAEFAAAAKSRTRRKAGSRRGTRWISIPTCAAIWQSDWAGGRGLT